MDPLTPHRPHTIGHRRQGGGEMKQRKGSRRR